MYKSRFYKIFFYRFLLYLCSSIQTHIRHLEKIYFLEDKLFGVLKSELCSLKLPNDMAEADFCSLRKKNQILHFLKNQYPVCTLYIGPQEAIFVCFCSFISLSLKPFGENLGCNPGIIVDILFIGSVWMFLKHPGSFSLSYITKRVIFWHASELRSNTLWWYLFSFLLLHCSPLNAYDARRDFVCVKKSLISYSLTIFGKLSLNSADRLSWNIFFIHKLQIDT